MTVYQPDHRIASQGPGARGQGPGARGRGDGKEGRSASVEGKRTKRTRETAVWHTGGHEAGEEIENKHREL